MSTSRAKRQFAGAAADPAQRQITAFFAKAPEGSTALPQPSAAPLQGPVIPDSVQASLMNVGMRIRKAVPEGYKVGNSTSAFKLWTNTATSAPELSAPEAKPALTHNHPTMAIRVTRPAATRELMPFCGLHKIGGMAAQPDHDDEDEYEDDDDDYEDENMDDDVPALDDVPEFTISQESADSYVCEPSRKRMFEGDEDRHGRRDHTDAQWSQLADNARVIALPRARVKGSGLGNMAANDDFEEATFLVFGEGPNREGF